MIINIINYKNIIEYADSNDKVGNNIIDAMADYEDYFDIDLVNKIYQKDINLIGFGPTSFIKRKIRLIG